MVGGTGLEPV